MSICPSCDQEMTDAKTVTCAIFYLSTEFKDEVLRARLPYQSSEMQHGLPPLPDDRCHDCNVKPGGYHHPGCDMEQCPKCGGQLISCGCLKDDAFEEPVPPFELDLRDAIREALAAYAHHAWSGWIQYQLSKGSYLSMIIETGETKRFWLMPPWAVERWQRQATTLYKDLPDEEKTSDRQEADKMLALMPSFVTQKELDQLYSLANSCLSAISATYHRKAHTYCDIDHLILAEKLLGKLKELGGTFSEEYINGPKGIYHG